MILLFAPLAAAAQLVMQLDSGDIRAGQTVGLTVQLTDAEVTRPPKVPAPPGVTVEYVSASHQVEFINFNQTQIETLRYDVVATTPGDYTLGPLKLATASGVLTAPAVTLHVGERPTTPNGVDELEADLGTDTAWVGQTLVYHLKYATSRRLVAARIEPSTFEAWMQEPGVEPVSAEYHLGTGGTALAVEEAWYAYRTQKPGKVTVPAAQMLAQFAVSRRRRDPLFDDLFQDVQNETAVSPPLPLTIKALPTAGRPADFSGLVGAFTATVTPSASQVRVGDTVTLDITLTGDGALTGFTLPAWPGEGYRVYDDAPVADGKLSDGKFTGTATFKRAVVPERPGPLTLPALHLNWFDPHEGRYVEQDLPAVTLDVTGSASAAVANVEGFGPKTPVAKTGVDTLGEDILPVRTDARIAPPWPGGWAWLACGPGALLLLGQLAPHLRPRARGPVEKTYSFADLPDEPEARLAGLERIFREAAGRRLGRPAPELKREDVATLGEEAAEIYKELDLARYRGGRDLPEARVRAWVGGGR